MGKWIGRLLAVGLGIALVMCGGVGYLRLPRLQAGLESGNSPSARKAEEKIVAFLDSEQWKTFLAQLDTSVSESLASISQNARLSEKADLSAMIASAMTGDDDTTSTDSTSADNAQKKSESETAKAISKTNETMVDTFEEVVLRVSDFLPAWVPAREYVVVIAMLAALVAAICLVNKYVK